MVAFNPGMIPSSNPAYYPGGMPAFDGETFVPNSFTGNVLWLDAADTSSITDDGGAVSRWFDKSGNANHTDIQSTGSKQPTTDATTQNSKNVIDFDGGDTLELPSALYAIPNGNSTLFLVGAATDDAAVDAFISMEESTASRYILRSNNNTTVTAYRNRNLSSYV